jgi:hypothetical protein
MSTILFGKWMELRKRGAIDVSRNKLDQEFLHSSYLVSGSRREIHVHLKGILYALVIPRVGFQPHHFRVVEVESHTLVVRLGEGENV